MKELPFENIENKADSDDKEALYKKLNYAMCFGDITLQYDFSLN